MDKLKGFFGLGGSDLDSYDINGDDYVIENAHKHVEIL